MAATLTLPILGAPPPAGPRDAVLARIREKVNAAGMTLAQAIAERELYFRVSLVGNCNLSCAFCHNEGAPTRGKMDVTFARRAIEAAAAVGFRRVQLTGGEPLLHPQVAEFIAAARGIVEDVGITTNGVLLLKRVDDVVAAGIVRIHLSLQVEPLREAGRRGGWGVPPWLGPILDQAAEGRFILRLNLPVPADELGQARDFMRELSHYGCDLKVFSILPDAETPAAAYPVKLLAEVVECENQLRAEAGTRGRIQLRGYRAPTGIRCVTCQDYDKCKEQSHSLRLGSDRVLRPCLATRAWDMPLEEDDLLGRITEAALLSLDYVW